MTKLNALLNWFSVNPSRVVVAALVVLLVLAAVSASKAHAIELDQRQCVGLASWSQDVVWAKSVGADRAKVLESIEEQREAGGPVVTLLLRFFETLWTTAIPWQAVGPAMYRECASLQGRYPDAT